VDPSTALGFRASPDGSNLEVRTTVSGSFTPLSDLINNTSGFRINPTTSNIDLKDVTTGGSYTPLQQYISNTSGFRINPTTSNIDLKDVTTGSTYVGLQNYISRRPIRYKTVLSDDITLATDYTVICDITGGGTINISDPDNSEVGQILVIKNINTTSLNISGYIDSTNPNTIGLVQNQSITLQAANISSQNQYFIIG